MEFSEQLSACFMRRLTIGASFLFYQIYNFLPYVGTISVTCWLLRVLILLWFANFPHLICRTFLRCRPLIFMRSGRSFCLDRSCLHLSASAALEARRRMCSLLVSSRSASLAPYRYFHGATLVALLAAPSSLVISIRHTAHFVSLLSCL